MTPPESPDPSLQLLELIASSWKTQAICTAVRLGVPEALSAGPQSASALASSLQADADALTRLLKGLASLGICYLAPDGAFGLTETGRRLIKDAPDSLHAWAVWWGQYCWPEWGELAYSVQTGKSSRHHLKGTEGFTHLHNDPQAAEVFNRSMKELTHLATQAIVAGYPFGSYSRIADIGGGSGLLITEVLKAFPNLQGTLFDLEHAREAASETISQASLEGRCRFTVGDFFQEVVGNHDLYILKSVIHDWNDADAARILAACRQAMAPDAKLLLIERVGSDQIGTDFASQDFYRGDLHMLVAHAGRERSLSDFRRLLEASGLRLAKVETLPFGLSLLEAEPASGSPT